MTKLFLFLSLLSVSAFAQYETRQNMMGRQSIELFKMMAHPAIKECMKDIDSRDLVDVKIKRLAARCPFCVSYTITAGVKDIDGVDRQVMIEVEGKKVDAPFGGDFGVQGYECKTSFSPVSGGQE